MPFDIITVTPTLENSTAYNDGDVLFTSTAVKLPHNNCRLINIQGIWDDAEGADEEFNVLFFQNNTHALGTAGAAPDITAAEISENVFLGARRVIHDTSTTDGHLGVPSLLSSGGAKGDSSAEHFGPFEDLALKSGATKNTVYMQAYIDVGGTVTSDSSAASDLILTLHVEY
tara:strand:- start:82 stop:597 length:516 start_codon:yes stop_codon:yes gene_type:complete